MIVNRNRHPYLRLISTHTTLDLVEKLLILRELALLVAIGNVAGEERVAEEVAAGQPDVARSERAGVGREFDVSTVDLGPGTAREVESAKRR